MKRFCSILNQLLQIFSRVEFQKAVEETKAERHARGFRSWDQFVAMLFCHLADANSLREICGGLASCEGRLSHFGTKVPARSTLAYANTHRNWELMQKIFHHQTTIIIDSVVESTHTRGRRRNCHRRRWWFCFMIHHHRLVVFG